jgi:hypothetical protein
MDRKEEEAEEEEETIAELSATTATPQGALRWTPSRLKIDRTCPKAPIS